MRRFWLVCFLIFGSIGAATPAFAQTVIGPTRILFVHPDAELAVTGAYHVDFFQCASVSSTGACVSQAASPFQGADVMKAAVVTLSPPDASGANRQIAMNAAPVSGVLGSMPAGVPFVGTLQAVGDPNAGGTGASARSAASNPFFAAGKTPASPTGVLAK